MEGVEEERKEIRPFWSSDGGGEWNRKEEELGLRCFIQLYFPSQNHNQVSSHMQCD